ncbi:MAG: hypothetical protein MKZ56_04925 [Candidatus Thalassarchaeum sp.]|nr:hypothetical protein [Candidatus Thalassarchaeum sp.]|tara:strand:- start:944 stop:1873 length:930 start_codon:yes stop_codon:yes gene_type:complete
MAAGQSGDTAHLYEGKVIRAAAPSRKKLAGKMKAGGTEVPDDAVPEVHIPTFVESLFGGPLVPKMKFLPADRMVQTLQLIGGGLMMLLAVLTYLVTPADGTFWNGFALWLGFDALGQILHLIIVIAALAAGFFGIFRRDARGLLASYVLFILISLRFAASKDTFDTGILAEVGEFWTKQLIVLYAVSLVMYMEVTNGIIRFSMLDTSIRTGEVYVMNVKKVLSRYHISLVVTPVIAAFVASATLLINVIIPWFFEFFDKETSVRLSQSVELTSVYGVALGTMFVFILVATLFAANIPLRIQQWRESADD